MPFVRFAYLVSFVLFLSRPLFIVYASAADELPRSIDQRLKIELFAEAPQVVTPTGIDVDSSGRVWVIESNTHFPPEGYTGHPTDRILVMQDEDHDGKADKIVVFKDGLTHSMSVAVKPVWLDLALKQSKKETVKSGASEAVKNPAIEVYIATRRDIFYCIDTDGDLICDEIKTIVHLETSGNYPHNGLAGFAFDASGHMFFGFGENLGADYKIIGSDGTTLSGGGEGGNVYRCWPDGTKLERWATGFWNPHASCFDAFGRLFTLDNDPDSRPPCRLLHIVKDGDYGYRFRNGRKGTHPFTAWNGEIPGTLPMVSGTGEAPSGIICYESEGLPADYIGTLLVGSWGDHRIDKFMLKPRGVSFESIPQPVIQGDENFRPVGLAVAPDGSIYASDWVSKEYKLHGKGRVWRISAREAPKTIAPALDDILKITSPEKLVKLLESPTLNVRRLAAKRLSETAEGNKAVEQIAPLSNSGSSARLLYEISGMSLQPVNPKEMSHWFEDVILSDPFELSETIHWIASFDTSADSLTQLLEHTKSLNQSAEYQNRLRELELRQLAILLAARAKFPKDPSFAKVALQDPHPSVRRLAVQWVGEEKLASLRPDVEKVLASDPMTNDLFISCLASLSLLDGVAPAVFEKSPPSEYIVGIVNDVSRPVSLRTIALRMLSPSHKELNAGRLGEMLDSKDFGLQRESVRTLQHSPIPERNHLLRRIAADASLDNNLRADAVAGLAGVNSHAKLDQETQDLLINLATRDKNLGVRLEAIRSLRGALLLEQKQPSADSQLTRTLKQIADSVTKETEETRKKLSNAISFAIGSRPPVTVNQIVADVVNPKAKAAAEESVESGRRAFFHVNGAGCYKCHMVSGRGGQVGPDLTVIARTMDRKKLAESIVEPSKEISPQFTTWAIETKSGKVLTGMLLGEEVNGDLRLGNNQGEIFFVPFNQIESRIPLKTSIMPEKLLDSMTTDEFRDLISYLETLK